jgi:hypothetical protein
VTGAPRAGVTVTCDSNLLRENVEANARWMAVRRSAVTGRVSEPTICEARRAELDQAPHRVDAALQSLMPIGAASVVPRVVFCSCSSTRCNALMV